MSVMIRLTNRLQRHYRIAALKRRQIRFFPPNYLFNDCLRASSIVIDVGCGNDADFSVQMINRYGLRSFGVDPTRKHVQSLLEISEKTGGRFRFFPLAVTSKYGQIRFNESAENVSGSVLYDHTNVKKDHINTYTVESVTLEILLVKLGLSGADYLKLDLEGAEYELLCQATPAILQKFDQILVEFHHHCIDQYSQQDTQGIVDRLKSCGFEALTIDHHDYLFSRIPVSGQRTKPVCACDKEKE